MVHIRCNLGIAKPQLCVGRLAQCVSDLTPPAIAMETRSALVPAFSGASTVHVTCPTEAFANAGPECALTVFCTVESNAGDCVLIEKCLASVFFFFLQSTLQCKSKLAYTSRLQHYEYTYTTHRSIGGLATQIVPKARK